MFKKPMSEQSSSTFARSRPSPRGNRRRHHHIVGTLPAGASSCSHHPTCPPTPCVQVRCLRDLWTRDCSSTATPIDGGCCSALGLAVTCAGMAAGMSGFLLAWRSNASQRLRGHVLPHDDDPKLYRDEYARREINRSVTWMSSGSDRSVTALWLAPGVRLPTR